jgi:ElaB/YqjD/DUF883 family membrane-anchored ribosome-binding protein
LKKANTDHARQFPEPPATEPGIRPDEIPAPPPQPNIPVPNPPPPPIKIRGDVPASQDFVSDLAALRDDVAKLSSSVSGFIRSHTAATTNTVFDAVDNTRQKISDTASRAQDRVAGASTELETTIERNPLMAVLVAMVAGILVGILAGC